MNNNVTAEMALIGSLIVDAKAAAPKLIESISPEHFDEPILRKAYADGMAMFSQCGYVDYIPLLHKLTNEFDEQECKNILSNCVVELGSISALPSYIKAVKDCYKARELVKICTPFTLGGEADSETIDQQLEGVGQRIGELLRNNEKKGLVKVEDIAIEQYKRLFDKDLLKNRIKTGFPKLDAIIKGVYNKNLVILAARPAVGKSAMALNLALNFSRSAKKVALYSLEMGLEELFERFVANLAPANLGVIQDRDFGDHTAANIATASATLSKLPIYINDSGYQTVQSIRTEIQIKKIDVVVIDYLQLITPTGKADNRNNEVAKITRGLKCMAQDLDIPVIALSQLNRAKGETDEPTLSDLRDSGAIEQDADKVWFMWLNGEQKDQQVKQIAFRAAKTRNGMTGEVVLNYRGALMQFEETNFEVIREKRKRGTVPWEEVRDTQGMPWQ